MPVLEAVGRGVTRLQGAPSSANVVKLAGNFLIASTISALGEAFALTQKAGVARETFLDVSPRPHTRRALRNHSEATALRQSGRWQFATASGIFLEITTHFWVILVSER